MVPGWQARLPEAVVRFVPAPPDRLDHRLQDAPLAVAYRAAPVGDRRQQVGDRAEDVELELVVGEVADPHRPGAGVAGQGVDDRLGAEFVPLDGVERVQPLRVPAGAFDDAVDPAQERLGLAQRAEVDQGAGGHRRVAQPAVAVVPVADAAELLRQGGGGGGEDRAGRLVAEPAQRQRAARDQVRGRCWAAPASATQSRQGRSARLCRSSTGSRGWFEAVRAEAQLQGERAAERGEIDGGPGGLEAAVAVDLPLHAGGVERDRFAGAEHQQAVAERLQLHGDLPELRPRRELQPDRGVAGEHPDQHRVAGAGGVGVGGVDGRQIQPVGDGQPRPAGLHRHGVAPVALARAGCRRAAG